MKSPRSFHALLAGFALAPALPAAAVGLAEVSPFLPPARAAAPTVTENPPLELRGIMGQGADRLFNIYNPATKQSAWVGLDQPGQNFQVRSHEESAQTVSVSYGGQNVVLKLVQAKIAPLTEARPPAAASGPVPINVQPAVLPRQPTPEQQRQLEAVAAEVERRRQLRNQMQRQPEPKKD